LVCQALAKGRLFDRNPGVLPTVGTFHENRLSRPSYIRRIDWQELLVLLSLLVFFVWVRFLTLEPIEIGGDAIQKWFFVRRWAYQSPFEGTQWNHHFTRMGDNVPVFLIQKIFGTAPWVYYVGPSLAFLAAAFLVYVVGKRLSGRVTGVLAAIAVTAFGPMRRAASQMVPSMFSCMYVMLATYFLVRYVQSNSEKRWRWLVFGALALFGGYLSHESNVFFVPGFACIIWLYGRNLRHVLLFLGVLLGGFLLETAMYASLTDFPSRLHITMQTHLGGSPGLKIEGVWGLLGRFRTQDFGRDFRLYFYFWPFAALGIALFSRSSLTRLIALLPFSFLFLTTFLVRGVDPIRTLTSFQSRYLVAAVPLICLCNVLFFTSLAGFVGRQLTRLATRSERLRPLLERGRELFSAEASWRRGLRLDLLWIVPLLVWFGSRYYPAGGVMASLEHHPLVTWRETQAVIVQAYRRHMPIVGPKKSIALAYYVYLDDETLLQDGRLPPFWDKVAKYDKRRIWLSVDPARYAQDVRRMRKGKNRGAGKPCMLELGRNQRFMTPLRNKPLPPSCEAKSS
jgi:hypothetical protein